MYFVDLLGIHEVATRMVPREIAGMFAQTSKNVRRTLCAGGGLPTMLVLRPTSLRYGKDYLAKLPAWMLAVETDVEHVKLSVFGDFKGLFFGCTHVLRRISFCDCGLTTDMLTKTLPASDLTFPVLVELRLRRNTLTNAGEFLAGLLARCTRLHTLDVRETALNTRDATELFGQAARMPGLTHLETSTLLGCEGLTHLTHLCFVGEHVRTEEQASFTKVVGSAHGLRHIKLCGVAFGPALRDCLVSAGTLWPELEDLHVCFRIFLCRATDYALVLNGLSACTHLVHLNLDVDAFRVEGGMGAALARVRTQCTRLKYLCPGRHFNAVGLAHCAHFVGQMRALTRLDLGPNMVPWKKAILITHCSYLADLTCAYTEHHEPSFRAFADYLGRPHSPLTRLVVLHTENVVDYDELLYLATQLRELRLQNYSRLKPAPTVLNALTCLQSLALYGHSKVPPKMPSSLKAIEITFCDVKNDFDLPRAPGLFHVSLVGNGVTRPGMCLLGHGASLARLHTLDLASNEIGDTGAAEVADALAHMPVLVVLGLGNNRIGDDGFVALATAIGSGVSYALARVTLGGNPANAEHACAPMLTAFARCPGMGTAVLPRPWREYVQKHHGHCTLCLQFP